jgi:hypothetical protein
VTTRMGTSVGQDHDALRHMLWRMLPGHGLSLSMVTGLGGDQELTVEERQHLAVLLVQRDRAIYSDLLFTLTHQWFDLEESEALWNAILKHKYEVSAVLGRNIRITVAAVDYLYNMRGQSGVPAIVAEQSM